MRRDEDRRRRLPWLAAMALVVGPLVLTPPAHAAASAVADQGIQDTGDFASYDVMANDGTDGSQTITLPGNADADVTTDGFEVSVDLSAHAVPFWGPRSSPTSWRTRTSTRSARPR